MVDKKVNMFTVRDYSFLVQREQFRF